MVADSLGAAVVALMVLVSIFVGAHVDCAAVITGVIFIRIGMDTDFLSAAVVTLVVLVGILVGAHVDCAAVITGVVLIRIGMGADFPGAAVVALVVLICIGMGADFLGAAIIALMVLVGILVGTDSLGASIVALMVLVGIFVGAHVGLAAAPVALVVLVGIHMAQCLAGGCTALGAGLGCCTGGICVGMGRDVRLAADIAGMILISGLVGAVFQHCPAAVVADVVPVRSRVAMVALIDTAAIVTDVILVCVGVALGRSLVGGIAVAAVAGIGGIACCLTGGCRHRSGIAVGGNILSAADITAVILVGGCIRAGFQHCPAAVVTDVVLVRGGVAMVAHVGLAAAAVALMILVGIHMAQRCSQFRSANLAGLCSRTGGRVSFGMGQCFSLGGLADRAGLGGFTGSLLPVVTGGIKCQVSFQCRAAGGADHMAGAARLAAGLLIVNNLFASGVLQLPLGIQGEVLRQSHLGPLCIAGAAAVSFCIPAGKPVAGTAERIGCQGRIFRRDGLYLHGALAAVGFKGHGVYRFRLRGKHLRREHGQHHGQAQDQRKNSFHLRFLP